MGASCGSCGEYRLDHLFYCFNCGKVLCFNHLDFIEYNTFICFSCSYIAEEEIKHKVQKLNEHSQFSMSREKLVDKNDSHRNTLALVAGNPAEIKECSLFSMSRENDVVEK
jgi:hypothetical protein